MELIKNSLREDGIAAVSARELYDALGFNKAHWAKWYKKNIVNNPYAIENQDWQGGFTLRVSGNEIIDCALTPDFAKKLAMLARTDKGNEVRDYFLACEKKAISRPELSMKEVLLIALKSEEEKERLQIINDLQAKELIQAAPLVSYAKEVLTSESTYNTNLIAKEAGMSAVSLNQFLHVKQIQYKQGETWVLYHKYQNLGYTKTKTHTYTGANGEVKTSMQTVWTEQGRKLIHELVKNNLKVA